MFSRPWADQRGFTLVELLVAVVLGAVVLLGVYALYGRVLRVLRFSGTPPHLLVRARTASRSEAGVALLEVLVAAVVVGIAAIGIAFMYSYGNTWVVAKGDDRVALGLAQQKIEQFRAAGYSSASASGASTTEPPFPASGVAGDRKFTRITCIQNVTDTDVSTPAYTGGTTGSPCAAGAPTTTQRITVIVQPAQSPNQLYADPPVILQAWLTWIPGGI